MSKKNYQEAISIIEANKEKIFVKFPQTDNSIQFAQTTLEVMFPETYINFQKAYGSFGFGSQDIFGLTNEEHLEKEYVNGNVIHMTLDARKNLINFPHHFIVIHELGNGELSCLDTSRMNAEDECPVVAWYFGAIEDIAEDFGAFLLEKVQAVIAK